MQQQRGIKAVILLLASLSLFACGGGGPAGPQPDAAAAANSFPGAASSSSSSGSSGVTYTVGGTVTGLSGTGLVLQITGGQDLAVSTNGAIIFPGSLRSGSSYTVTVKNQPSAYREICGVSNESGTVTDANVTDVSINCSTVVGFLYVAIGSANQIFSYGITSGTGAPIPFGVPVATGSMPSGIASSPDGHFLYVPNEQSSSLSIYAVDSSSGTLTPSGSLTTSNLQPMKMVISPAGFLFLYGGVPVGPGLGYSSFTLSTYAIDASSGALTPTGTTLTFDPMAAMTAVATTDGKWLYVLTGAIDSNTPSPVTITAYRIDPSTGALAAGSVMRTMSSLGSTTSTMAVDPLGRYLYLTSEQGTPTQAAATVLPYAVDPGTGALTAIGSGTQIASNAGALTVDPTGRYLYVTNNLNFNGSSDGIQAMAIDQSSGSVSPIGSQPATYGQPSAVVCDPSGQFVYVVNGGPAGTQSTWSDFAAFSISQSAGSAGQLLATGSGAIESPSFGAGAVSLAVIE